MLREGSSFRNVWVRSYLKMHSSLTRRAPGDPLIVMHNDVDALQRLAADAPWIVSVAESEFSNVAYVVIDDSKPGRLAQLRKVPFVQFVCVTGWCFSALSPSNVSVL
ncbi:MAG: hypothetical protein CM1200mP20_14070 [Pseudomonadota bacterium]|nr:MAG: hypothetical protein CM1200mP20_14070 [Pseudomonadota bacterium]